MEVNNVMNGAGQSAAMQSNRVNPNPATPPRLDRQAASVPASAEPINTDSVEFRTGAEIRAERLPQNESEVSDAAIARAVSEANKALEMSNFRLSYGVHEATNVIMVRVYDFKTEEVIRELPPESRLDALAKIKELSGLVLDNLI